MHIRLMQSTSCSVRYGVNSVVTRLSCSQRQTGRNFVDRSYYRKTGRYGVRANFRRSFLKLRIPSNYLVVASSVTMEQSPSSQNESEIDSSVQFQFKRSELSNGPFPATIELGELLGQGTFGEVYRGVDKTTNQEYAIKIISKKRSGADQASIELVVQRVEHEVSIWCELNTFHGAVRLEKFYEDAENVYLVQELCSGGSLQDLMAMRGSLSEVETAHVMLDVLSMLSYCHHRNICYGDVKPANFILSRPSPNLDAFCDIQSSPTKEFLKVVDFGSCEHVPKNGLRGIKGTPLYTAPEVQHSRYGVEVDIWSAGILMYYLLSGEIPFIGKPTKQLNPSALTFYLAHGGLKFEGKIWESISQEAKDLISIMLERNTKKRVTAEEALKNPWIQKRACLSMITTSFSDICPMEASKGTLKEV